MKRGDKITLFLLVAMSVFLFADQRIMSAILPELSVEYGVSTSTLGYIGSAFILAGALISLFFGYFSDLISRKKLLIIVILVGEIPCLLTGIPFFTRTIGSFTLLRILTGIGIGGIFPISFSLIADYFDEEHRPVAAAWLSVSWAVGMLIGPTLAGFLTRNYGWRLTFILVAVPNFPLVLLFYLFARDPEKGRTEAHLADLIEKGIAYKQKIRLSDIKILFANRTNLAIFFQGIFGTIPWGVLGYWAIIFLEEHRGFPKEAATMVYLFLGIGATLGTIVWAVVGEKLYNRKPAYMPMLNVAGIFLGIIPAFILFNLPVFTPTGFAITGFMALSFFAGFLVAVPSGCVKAMLMNVNRPEHRGSVFAIFNLTDNLGQGFGPAIGGLLIPLGYLFTMNFSIFWWVPCGIIFIIIIFTIGKDRDSLQGYLANQAEVMRSTPGDG